MVTAPGAPRALTATAGNRRVDLSWRAADDGGGTIDHYTVHCAPACGERGADFQIPGSATAYPIDGLRNGREYTFRVTATNEIGTGPAATAFAEPTVDVPGPPTVTRVVAQDYGKVEIYWSPPEERGRGITGYRVAVADGDPGSSWTVGDTNYLVISSGALQRYYGQAIAFTVVALGNGPSGEPVSGPAARSAEVVPYAGASAVTVELTRSSAGPRRVRISVTPSWQGKEGLLTVRLGGQSLNFPPAGGVQEVDVPWDSTQTAEAVACLRMDCVRGKSNALQVARPTFHLTWTDVATCVRAPDGGNTSERGNLWQVRAVVDLKGVPTAFVRPGQAAWGYDGLRLPVNGDWGVNGGTVQGGWGPDNGRVLWVEAALVVDDLGTLDQRIEGREASGCPPY